MKRILILLAAVGLLPIELYAAPSIGGLSLINAVTGVGRPFSNGAVIDYKAGTVWYIVARDPKGVTRVQFNLDNGQYVSTDNTEPFDSDPGTPPLGKHRIVATPMKGTVSGTPVQVTFSIVDTTPTPSPTPTPTPTPTATPTPSPTPTPTATPTPTPTSTPTATATPSVSPSATGTPTPTPSPSPSSSPSPSATATPKPTSTPSVTPPPTPAPSGPPMTVNLTWSYAANPPANFKVWYGYTYSSGAIAAYADSFVLVPGTQTWASIPFPASNQRVFSVGAILANGEETAHSNAVVYPGTNNLIVPTPSPTP